MHVRCRPLASTLATALLCACGAREPGPHESEHGEIIYWRLTSAIELLWDNCSDGADRDERVKAPPYQEDMFLIYRVADNGRQAVAQDCTTTSPSTCSDDPLDIVFEILDHTLSWDPPQELHDEPGDCDMGSDQLWQVQDGGETGLFEAFMDIDLVGDPLVCAELDQDIRETSPNGLGLDGCRMTLRAELEYYPTDFPIIRTVTGQR